MLHEIQLKKNKKKKQFVANTTLENPEKLNHWTVLNFEMGISKIQNLLTRFTDAGEPSGFLRTSREVMTYVQGVICFWTKNKSNIF